VRDGGVLAIKDRDLDQLDLSVGVKQYLSTFIGQPTQKESLLQIRSELYSYLAFSN